jgi:hypothetical protein
MLSDEIRPPPGLPTDPARLALMPNLFVIGASKAGSSALHAYLNAHPDIRMSDEKEPCFFVDRTELAAAWPIMARQACSRDWDAYLDLWRGGETARYRGEGSVYYSQSPHRSGVAARIAAVAPHARILYLVREPVGRAIGHYWQRAKEFQDPLPLERALQENTIYRDTSDYAMQLRQYLAVFPRAQIHVIVAERLRTQRRKVLAEVFDWLDLPPVALTDDQISERHKSPPTSRQARYGVVPMLRNSAAWAVLRRALPKTAVNRLRRAATVEFKRDAVDDTAARAQLAEWLAPRIAEFESLLGEAIPEWRKA